MHRLRKSLRPQVTKLLIICNSFNTNSIYFKTARRRSKVTHQQLVSRSGSVVTERGVGERCQHPPLAFVLEENILSTCCNKDDVM